MVSRPVEDLGLLVIDHPQVTFSASLVSFLFQHNVTVLICDEYHHPVGSCLAYNGHTLMTAHVQAQVSATLPLCKQLWKQTVQAKIHNQYKLLERIGIVSPRLRHLIAEVRSGDTSNREAAAAAMYWKLLFSPWGISFRRDRYGMAPNNLLNYGYAILRSTVAKNLVAAGLLPMLGIHHRNSLNAFCLADDIMEPYRPMVDAQVLDIMNQTNDPEALELDKSIKQQLLQVLTHDVWQDGTRSPLSVAVSRTCQSLARCYSGEKRRIAYATFAEV